MAQTVEVQARSIYDMCIDKLNIAKSKVDEMTEKVKEFELKEQVAAGREKASAYINGTLEKSREALADLTKQAQALKDNATEIPVRSLSSAFARVNESLGDIQSKAKNFDEQHGLSTRLSDILKNPREQAEVAVASASSFVVDAAHSALAQLQGVSDGIKYRVMVAADEGLSKVMPVAASCDAKLHITEGADLIAKQVKAFNETYHVSDKVLDLDKRWSVSDYLSSALSSILQLDQRITGGRVEPAVTSAYGMGLTMAGYLKDKYDEGRKAGAETAASAPAAPAPVAPAPAAPAPAAPAPEAPKVVAPAAESQKKAQPKAPAAAAAAPDGAEAQ